MSKLSGAAVLWATTFAALIAFLVTGDTTCSAQDWRDPAFQQPLQQYYSPGRYPLEATENSLPGSTAQLAPKSATSPSNRGNAVAASEIESVSANPTPRPIATRIAPSAKSKTPQPPKESGPKKNPPNRNDSKTGNQSHPVIDFSIYRDPAPFPIDPRKPCSVCRRSVSTCHCGVDHGQHGLGNQGVPYQDREPGGCACGKNCPDKRPAFSVYWPRPFSAKHTPGHPHRCNCDQCATRINDRFDHLVNFKLIDYQRKDNGYCGPEADPFGCLGESKHQ